MSRSSSEEDLHRKSLEAFSSDPPPYPGQPLPAQSAPYPAQAPYAGQQYPPAGQYPPAQPTQYPPPQAAQYPPPPQGISADDRSTQIIIAKKLFRTQPVHIMCPHCSANITTALSYDTGTFTYLLAGGICCIGGWFGCCLIPFFVNDLKEVIHYCPNCNGEVGRYNRL